MVAETVRGLDTDTISINMGPHHPSTHGIFRMLVTLDGETVVGVEPKVATCTAALRSWPRSAPTCSRSP